jgi:Helix-turn-helix domain
MTNHDAQRADPDWRRGTAQDKTRSWVRACELLAPSELAERWRMSVRTLDRWRAAGEGPAWLALGGRILYRVTDVEAYEASKHRPLP